MKRSFLPRIGLLFLVLSLALIPSSRSSARQKVGTLKYKVKSSQLGDPALSRVYLRAFDAYSPGTVVSQEVEEASKVKIEVPAGPYVLLVTSFDLGALEVGEQTKVRMVKAKKKKTTSNRQASSLDSPVVLAAAAISGPDGPTVSVGNVAWQDGSGGAYLSFDGKPWRFDDMFVSALASVTRTCRFYTVEDREYGRFGEILKELELQSSDKIDPSQRVNYQRALEKLAAWAPQLRLTGTVRSGSQDLDGGATTSMQLVDLVQGKTVWSKSYSTASTEQFFSLPEQVARDVERYICGDELPSEIRGSFTSVTHLPAPYEGGTERYEGSMTFVLDDPDFWRAIGRPLGIGQYAPYIAVSESFRGEISGGAPCSVTGSTDDSYANPPPFGIGGVIQLEVRSEEGMERRYAIAVGGQSPHTTTATLQCSGSPETPLEKSWDPTIESPAIYEDPYRVSEGKMNGSYSDPLHDYSWSFDLIP